MKTVSKLDYSLINFIRKILIQNTILDAEKLFFFQKELKPLKYQ
ncbi:hypothetical protein JCM19300_2421 [Algibacter lectus]|uniref:Uncharacterized protein n=1 Tax=Algibacter lectus TaxID=221126 RepID=A0A090VE81_9FLAO|nr:hypothetical protein JCM19300_2421 [Algibacter lectus]